MRTLDAGQAFLQRKLDARFDQLDTKGNGYLEREDFLAQARAILQQFGEAEDSDKGHALMAAFDTWWMALSTADSDHDGRLSRQEYRTYTTSPEMLSTRKYTNLLSEALMDIVDSDGDGRITFPEFRGITPYISQEEARTAFQLLDGDGDGYVSREERAKAVKEYFSSTDPACPGNQIFGRML